ncbi:hypothetical protein ACTXT7_008222 [Hymenolepis weldensis]
MDSGITTSRLRTFTVTSPPMPTTEFMVKLADFVERGILQMTGDNDGSGTLVALNSGSQTPQGHQQQTQHHILSLAPSPATKLTAPSNTEPTKQGVPSLEQIETVWLDLRRLQQEITEEASHYGLNIVSSDGFPGAFCVATANESEVNSPAYQQLRDLSNQHNRLCSLARLLICDRLDYLDRTDPFIQHHRRYLKLTKSSLEFTQREGISRRVTEGLQPYPQLNLISSEEKSDIERERIQRHIRIGYRLYVKHLFGRVQLE